MREVEDLIRDIRERVNRQLNVIGWLVFAAVMLLVLSWIGALLATSNVWDILRSGR
jgi:hypothetical protein